MATCPLQENKVCDLCIELNLKKNQSITARELPCFHSKVIPDHIVFQGHKDKPLQYFSVSLHVGFSCL